MREYSKELRVYRKNNKFDKLKFLMVEINVNIWKSNFFGQLKIRLNFFSQSNYFF